MAAAEAQKLDRALEETKIVLEVVDSVAVGPVVEEQDAGVWSGFPALEAGGRPALVELAVITQTLRKQQTTTHLLLLRLLTNRCGWLGGRLSLFA